MKRRYGFLVDLALRSNDALLMKETYAQTEGLPNTQTAGQLNVEGYVLDGQLINGNDCLQICFKDGIPHLLKVCTAVEYRRMSTWQNFLRNNNINQDENIIPFELTEVRLKHFAFMPLHPVTLEHLHVLNFNVLNRVWSQLSSALKCFHAHGFCHMDIKPSNILISSSGNFIVADLGSVVHHGERSQSTQAYLPKEMWDPIQIRGPLASATVDWWMFAVTIYERVCGGDINATSPSYKSIKDSLVTNVPPHIMNQLFPLLEENINLRPVSSVP
jgi:serine/threonine protein kinase